MVNSLSRATALGVNTAITFLAVGLLTASRVQAEDAGSGSTVTSASAPASASASSTNEPLATIVVTAQRLNAARVAIQPQAGASTYIINHQAIQVTPGGGNAGLNQVLLQAPGVVQDSFGQLHVRGDHNGLQFRLNGVILPEGMSVFSQTLSPRLV